MLEKYAVRAGGGTNHRGGLDDGILIKDNHIRLGGGVDGGGAADEGGAVRRCRSRSKRRASTRWTRRVAAGADVILLDNLSIGEIREAVRRIAGRAKVEIFRRRDARSHPGAGATGADYVSVGALTHSAAAVDLSFELEPEPARVRRELRREPDV